MVDRQRCGGEVILIAQSGAANGRGLRMMERDTDSAIGFGERLNSHDANISPSEQRVTSSKLTIRG